jgi:hypothetical protein
MHIKKFDTEDSWSIASKLVKSFRISE